MKTIHGDSQEVKEIALKAFPGYKGKKFRVTGFQPMRINQDWSGGSRDLFTIVRLTDMQAWPVGVNGNLSQLPENHAVVRHTTFQGKDLGITIYVNPDNLAPSMPESTDIPKDEKIVLAATRGLKPSYAGVKDFRKQEAKKWTGIPEERFDQARERCKRKKLLDKRGAITNQGRNIIGDIKLETLNHE